MSDKVNTKKRLLALLNAFTKRSTMSPSDVHCDAEVLLLEIIGDEEITAAWNDASDFWWYS